MTIHVHSQTDYEHYVIISEDDGSILIDGCFIDRANAETRAEVLAKLYGCDGKTNRP